MMIGCTFKTMFESVGPQVSPFPQQATMHPGRELGQRPAGLTDPAVDALG